MFAQFITAPDAQLWRPAGPASSPKAAGDHKRAKSVILKVADPPEHNGHSRDDIVTEAVKQIEKTPEWRVAGYSSRQAHHRAKSLTRMRTQLAEAKTELTDCQATVARLEAELATVRAELAAARQPQERLFALLRFSGVNAATVHDLLNLDDAAFNQRMLEAYAARARAMGIAPAGAAKNA
jgi:ABC-type phosphate transport system auxiliary subunit